MKQRPTITEAKFKRHMHRAGRRAKVATRNAAKAAHHDSFSTAASHLRQAGVDDQVAAGMAATLRKKITGGRKGIAKKNGVRRPCTRYTSGQFLAGLIAYKPRKAEYKDARRHAITTLLDLAA